MKTIRVILLCLQCVVCAAQVNTISDLKTLLAQKNDKEKIERLAAIKFNKIMNDYRKAYGKIAYVWNDTAWIAARNHNSCMITRKFYGHGEMNDFVGFTGKSSTDRYFFAARIPNNPDNVCGENVIVTHVSAAKTIEETAANIAKTAFKEWKSSPGHNKNMLEKYKYSGVAFNIIPASKGKYKVYGTDVFVLE